MKVGYVINPAAGEKQSDKWIKEIHRVTDQKDFPYKIYITNTPGDGSNKARTAVNEGCDVIVAVGGDGTVREVVEGMLDSGAVLGVIPVGTGNDFTRSLGIPHDLESALECIFSCKSSRIDLGIVNDKYFINVASVGLDAQVVIEAQGIKRYFAGSAAYILGVFKALISHRPYNMHIETEEGVISRKAVLVAVANGEFYGGGMQIAPNACMDDGLLDIYVVNNMSKVKLVTLFPLLFSGRHIYRPEVECFKCSSMTIECDKGYINLDGDISGKCPAVFNIRPHAVKVLMP